MSEIGNALLVGSTWNIFGMQAGGPLAYTYPSNDSGIEPKRPQDHGKRWGIDLDNKCSPQGYYILNIFTTLQRGPLVYVHPSNGSVIESKRPQDDGERW